MNSQWMHVNQNICAPINLTFGQITAADSDEREGARLEKGHSSREIIVLNLANLPQNDSCSLIS